MSAEAIESSFAENFLSENQSIKLAFAMMLDPLPPGLKLKV
jgi:hypothetical protein